MGENSIELVGTKAKTFVADSCMEKRYKRNMKGGISIPFTISKTLNDYNSKFV